MQEGCVFVPEKVGQSVIPAAPGWRGPTSPPVSPGVGLPLLRYRLLSLQVPFSVLRWPGGLPAQPVLSLRQSHRTDPEPRLTPPAPPHFLRTLPGNPNPPSQGSNTEDLAKPRTVFWGLILPHTVTEQPLRH